jgi:hypothetical protein
VLEWLNWVLWTLAQPELFTIKTLEQFCGHSHDANLGTLCAFLRRYLISKAQVKQCIVNASCGTRLLAGRGRAALLTEDPGGDLLECLLGLRMADGFGLCLTTAGAQPFNLHCRKANKLKHFDVHRDQSFHFVLLILIL